MANPENISEVRSSMPYVGTKYVSLEPTEPATGLPRANRTATYLQRYILRESTRNRVSDINNITSRAQIGRRGNKYE